MGRGNIESWHVPVALNGKDKMMNGQLVRAAYSKLTVTDSTVEGTPGPPSIRPILARKGESP